MSDGLEDQIMLVADPILAFATVSGNETLAAEVRLTRSELDKTSDQRLDDVGQRIRAAAENNLPALAAYGLTQADLDGLEERTNAFSTIKATPRAAVATRAGRTETLPQLIRAARGILRDQLDRLMTRYRTTNPTFYAGYQSARVLVDRRGPGVPDAPVAQ